MFSIFSLKKFSITHKKIISKNKKLFIFVIFFVNLWLMQNGESVFIVLFARSSDNGCQEI